MIYATVYRKKKRLTIQYVRDHAALFHLKVVSFDLQENKQEAARLIKNYMRKWGEDWTHFALHKGWPFKDSRQITPIVPIPKRS